MKKELTEDELLEKALECQKKYEKKEIETFKKALTGEVTSNEQMIDELRSLNDEYMDEVGQYDKMATNLTDVSIKYYEEAEERGDSVVKATYLVLRLFGICVEDDKLVFVNEDGHPCDEYGVRLASDLEHRVFEVIPGGKK